jgi:hypothetical protein
MIRGEGGTLKVDLKDIGCVRVWTGFSWLTIGYNLTGFCEYGNEHLSSRTVGDYLE